MLLNVSALLWLQSPARSRASPQYAPGAYLGRAHRGPSPRGSRYASATIKKVPTRTGPRCAPSACYPC